MYRFVDVLSPKRSIRALNEPSSSPKFELPDLGRLRPDRELPVMSDIPGALVDVDPLCVTRTLYVVPGIL